jgi:hypothetical protein
MPGMGSVEADKAVSEEKDGRACVLLNPTLSEWPIESEFLDVLSLADTSGFPAIESKTLLKIPIGPHPYFSINLLRLSNASFIFRRLSSLPSTRLGPNRYVFPAEVQSQFVAEFVFLQFGKRLPKTIFGAA